GRAVPTRVREDPPARPGEDLVRIALRNRAVVRVVRLLVGGDVILVSPVSVRRKASSAAEALPHGRAGREVPAQTNGDVGATPPVKGDGVRAGGAGAAHRGVGGKPGDDAALDAMPEARNSAARPRTLE